MVLGGHSTSVKLQGSDTLDKSLQRVSGFLYKRKVAGLVGEFLYKICGSATGPISRRPNQPQAPVLFMCPITPREGLLPHSHQYVKSCETHNFSYWTQPQPCLLLPSRPASEYLLKYSSDGRRNSENRMKKPGLTGLLYPDTQLPHDLSSHLSCTISAWCCHQPLPFLSGALDRKAKYVLVAKF